MPYKITHEIHPNNETRVTLYKSRGVFLSLKERAAQVLSVSPEEVSVLATSAPAPAPSLDIRSDFRTEKSCDRSNSHKRTNFGLYAKRRIFRAGGAMDRFDDDRTNYLFLTATLPGDTDEAKWGIAEYAHEIIDGLKSWLSKRLSDRKEFYVWENQTRGALHFHYCIYCPDKKVQAEITKNFKRQMVRLYDGIERKHDTNLWGKWRNKSTRYRTAILQARTEVVYGSVAAYMAGYLAGKAEKHHADRNHRYYPKRWYGISRPLSALIESYTEKIEHEFTSLKTANEYYNQLKEEILDDAIDSTEYPHKIGEGKTIAVYHTLEKQQELWQAKKAMKYNHQQHPVINEFISIALRTTLELRQCLTRCKYLGELLPARSRLFLQDISCLTFMRNGQLNQRTIKELEVIFSSYDFASDSQAIVKRAFSNLRKFNLLAARYYPQMKFNQQGFLSNPNDWVEILDKKVYGDYRGTTTPNGGDANAVDGSHAHVASELAAPSYTQLEL